MHGDADNAARSLAVTERALLDAGTPADYYYNCFSGVSNSGHASKYAHNASYCEGFCWDHEQGWIHEYVHGDGTMYFHTGSRV